MGENDLEKALRMIAEGAEYEIKEVNKVRYVIVENLDFEEDNGENPKVVFEVYE